MASIHARSSKQSVNFQLRVKGKAGSSEYRTKLGRDSKVET